jgi:predicted metal-binding membrane protein
MSTFAARVVPLRHPEWWLYAVAAAAGFVLVVDALAAGTMRMPPGLDHWFLMVLAMMLPLAAPQARLVSLRSLWERRHRAGALFTVGLVGVWLGVGAVLTSVVRVLDPGPPGWLAPVLLVAAASWQVAPPRRRLLRRCGSVRLHAADGAAADVDCVRAGVRAGGLCVAGCGVAMLPMAVLPMGPEALLVMAGVLVVLLWERAAGPDPATRAGRPHEAVALLALALVVSLG